MFLRPSSIRQCCRQTSWMGFSAPQRFFVRAMPDIRITHITPLRTNFHGCRVEGRRRTLPVDGNGNDNLSWTRAETGDAGWGDHDSTPLYPTKVAFLHHLSGTACKCVHISFVPWESDKAREPLAFALATLTMVPYNPHI